MLFCIHTAVMHKSYINTANTKLQPALKQAITDDKKCTPERIGVENLIFPHETVEKSDLMKRLASLNR